MATSLPTPSTLRLRSAVPEDLPNLTEAYFSSFATNKIAQLVFPRASPAAQTFWHDLLAEELQDPNAHFLVVEDLGTAADDDAAKPAEFVAFAKWNAQSPSAPPVPPPPGLDAWPADGHPALAADFFAALHERHESIMGDRPHWYLELICTLSRHQGRGAGAMLVRWGVERADADGWECYLDSTPDGRRLYGKFGFEEVKALRFLDGAYEQCFMVRRARLKAAVVDNDAVLDGGVSTMPTGQ